MYFNNGLQQNWKNPKKTWQLLKEAANLNKTSDRVETIVVNDKTFTDPGQIAEKFNDYF